MKQFYELKLIHELIHGLKSQVPSDRPNFILFTDKDFLDHAIIELLEGLFK